MTPTLSSLAGSILVLSWSASPDTTYTAQLSSDGQAWASLPWVMTSTEPEMTYAHEPAGFPCFLRLRFSQDGDTNENSLPDSWELMHFGFLDVDPAGDPDEDGLSNHAEWIAQSDPLDFFNGELARIEAGCGSEWVVREDRLSSQAVSLVLRHASGQPWPHAPVRIFLDSRRPALLLEGEARETASGEIIAYTDGQGRISSLAHGIHVLGSPVSPEGEWLRMQAGGVVASVRITTVPESHTGPPRAVAIDRIDGETARVSWKGDPGDGSGFILEQRTPSNDWLAVLALSASELQGSGEDVPAFNTTFILNP